MLKKLIALALVGTLFGTAYASAEAATERRPIRGEKELHGIKALEAEVGYDTKTGDLKKEGIPPESWEGKGKKAFLEEEAAAEAAERRAKELDALK